MEKVLRTFNLSKIEFIKYQLDKIINHSINILNQTEITVLAYVYIYGVSAQQKLLEDRILTNVNSVINYIARLTKSGFLIKEREETEELEKKPGKKAYTSLTLNSKIEIYDTDFIEVSMVKLDNNSDTVYHPHFRK